MSATENPFEVLGVSEDADDKEIKRSFKKLAQKYHPDRPSGDKEKFAKISDAYGKIETEEARQKYKHQNMGGMFSGGMDMGDILSQFMGGFGGRSHAQSNTTTHTQHTIHLSLEELFSGVEKTYKISRKVCCPDCAGTGSKSKTSPVCKPCKGRGQVMRTMRMGNYITQNAATCQNCRGTGKSCSASDECGNCKNGLLSKKTQLKVRIEPGTSGDEELVFEGYGDEEYGKKCGDFIVTVKEKTHTFYKHRFGEDIVIFEKIKLDQALHGYTMKVPDLSGNSKFLEIDFGKVVIQPDSFLKVNSLGMPMKRNSSRRGDLYVKFEIEFPTWAEVNSPDNESSGRSKGPLQDYETVLAENICYSDKEVSEILSRKKSRRERKQSRESNSFSFSFF